MTGFTLAAAASVVAGLSIGAVATIGVTLAVEHGATLCSSDTDFSRFPGLQWEDPLQN